MPKKLTQEYVENCFKERGCELLDTYNNNNTRLKFICKCGETSTITFASFNDKNCYCENCGGTKKLTLDWLANEIAKFNYDLISDKYITARIKLELKCNKNHVCQISWNNFQKGKRCRTCFIETKWHKPEHRPFVLMCRSLLRNCLRNIKLKKTGKTEQMLGYDGRRLYEHITNHSNWNTVKDGVWHIDHIFPIKAFCDYNLLDAKLINCLENIQPLTGEDNLSKLAKYSKEKFENWLKSKSVLF
jgi:hypothetical protein